ncbi:MAG TPA: methionine--tRNA ligase subunit beta, partial [Terracidiphilus sp.]|nr:methionine--tRNA ligase subunit beta [Terracidiphilus sp.]
PVASQAPALCQGTTSVVPQTQAKKAGALAPEAVAPAAEPQSAPPQVEEKQYISIDDVLKVDLRVAQILVAERIPKADKLLRLEVDLGYEKRQILAGIAQYYEPEKLIGRKIVIVANLAPRMMRGLESNGMLLAASLPDGAPVLAGFLEEVPLGTRLK